MKIFIALIILSILSSCSNFINKIHRDLDKADGDSDSRREDARNRKRDNFARFRGSNYNGKNALTNKNMLPKNQREYIPEEKVRKRYTVDDLADNENDGSLWAGQGNNNYLFSLDQEKKSGDIIVINIFERLKQEITMELQRSVPSYAPPKNEDNNKQKEPKEKTAKTPVKQEKSQQDDTAYDKISSVIIEKINKDHFLLRGQKQILYKNKKRVIEIQALVSKRDIDSSDSIHSDKLLESTIYLVR